MPLIFLLFIALAISLRVIAGHLDRNRILAEVESKGGTIISITWSPFGTGWFGSQYCRLYEVRYQDALGNVHNATIKTNMWAGVYYTNEEVTRQSVSEGEALVPKSEDKVVTQSMRDLLTENEKLRRKLAELEDEK